MSNLYDDARHYFILQGILILCGIVSVSVGKCECEKKRCMLDIFFSLSGTLIGVSMPTPDAAAALVVPVILPLFVFAGFFINAKFVQLIIRVQTHDSYCLFRTIPNWLIWLKYISWLYYGNEMALINQWKDVTSIDCGTASADACFKNGTDVLNYYGFKEVGEMQSKLSRVIIRKCLLE